MIGLAPISPVASVEAADRVLAEEGEAARERSVQLVRRALDRSPADREAHEALATALGPGEEADAALHRALHLHPWSAEVRDRIAMDAFARGDRAEGSAELEESMARFPYFGAHGFLAPGIELGEKDPSQVVRALAEGDTMTVRLVGLEPDVVAAVERGLRRALDEVQIGDARDAILADLVLLLEARERFADAGALLRDEATRSAEDSASLQRAAQNFLRAHDLTAAHQVLVSALLRNPEEGELYRDLAVDIYAARADFRTAEAVLQAGERNALNMLPVYHGMTDVLAQRESARIEALANVPASVGLLDVGEGEQQ